MGRMKLGIMMLTVLIVTMLVSVCSAATAAPSPEAVDHKAMVTKAYEKLLALNSYHMSIKTTGSMSVQGNAIDIMMTGECDAQNKPMALKNVMFISLNNASPNASQKNEQKVTQYIEEFQDHLIIYSNVKDHWEKQIMPRYNPLDEYANYSRAITHVNLLAETTDSQVFSVTMDGSYLKENVERAMASSGTQNIKLPKSLFEGLGDFTYTVTIDRDTATISKIDMDLSGFLSTVGDNIANLQGVPVEQKRVIREIFNNAKMNTTVSFSNFNQVDKIVIPQEVKRDSLPNKYI